MTDNTQELDEILEQLDEDYDRNNYHAGLRTAKAKLQALLLRERELGKIEVLERLMTSDPTWTYDAAKDILIDSRAELSRLSREESHE
jgi:hypothetical protein